MDSISRVRIYIIHDYETTYQVTVLINSVVALHNEESRMSLLKCFSVFVFLFVLVVPSLVTSLNPQSLNMAATFHLPICDSIIQSAKFGAV